MKLISALAVFAFAWLCLWADWNAKAQSKGGSGSDTTTPRQLREGKRTYRLHCLACHGPEGKHFDKNFNLADDEWKHGDSLEAIEKVVTEGVKGTAMLPFKGRLSPAKIDSVSRYVYSFRDEEKK